MGGSRRFTEHDDIHAVAQGPDAGLSQITKNPINRTDEFEDKVSIPVQPGQKVQLIFSEPFPKAQLHSSLLEYTGEDETGVAVPY